MKEVITPKITLGKSVSSSVRNSGWSSVGKSVSSSVDISVRSSVWSSVYLSVNRLMIWRIRL